MSAFGDFEPVVDVVSVGRKGRKRSRYRRGLSASKMVFRVVLDRKDVVSGLKNALVWRV